MLVMLSCSRQRGKCQGFLTLCSFSSDSSTICVFSADVLTWLLPAISWESFIDYLVLKSLLEYHRVSYFAHQEDLTTVCWGVGKRERERSFGSFPAVFYSLINLITQLDWSVLAFAQGNFIFTPLHMNTRLLIWLMEIEFMWRSTNEQVLNQTRRLNSVLSEFCLNARTFCNLKLSLSPASCESSGVFCCCLLTVCYVAVMEGCCCCVLQTKERWAGAEDVVPAGEQEGADGTAGGTDEAAQGDTLTHRLPIVFQHGVLSHMGGQSFTCFFTPPQVCPCLTSPSCCFLLLIISLFPTPTCFWPLLLLLRPFSSPFVFRLSVLWPCRMRNSDRQ